MATILKDKRNINDENGILSSTSKQLLSARKHSVKKQAFGELKNVIHNTPYRGNILKADGLPGLMNNSKSLCNEVLRKEQSKQNFSNAQRKLEQLKLKTLASVPSKQLPQEEENFFEYCDLPRECCRDDSGKGIEQIWSEMNMIDDTLLNKIITVGDPGSDTKTDDKPCVAQYDDFKDVIDMDQLPPLFENISAANSVDDLKQPLAIPNLDDMEEDFGVHGI